MKGVCRGGFIFKMLGVKIFLKRKLLNKKIQLFRIETSGLTTPPPPQALPGFTMQLPFAQRHWSIPSQTSLFSLQQVLAGEFAGQHLYRFDQLDFQVQLLSLLQAVEVFVSQPAFPLAASMATATT